jgi:hypothetical protein
VADHGFTADQVETWLKAANSSRRARWKRWPDAARLAADLSRIDYTDRFTPLHQVRRQVRRITGMMRRLADAWDDPDLADETLRVLIYGVAGMLSCAHPEDAGRDATQQLIADTDALVFLGSYPPLFSNLLRQAACDAEWQFAQFPDERARTDHISLFYGRAAHTLERHTGSPPVIRAISSDARFVREVMQHVGLPWRPKLWRRCAEEWAMIRRGEGDRLSLDRLFASG